MSKESKRNWMKNMKKVYEHQGEEEQTDAFGRKNWNPHGKQPTPKQIQDQIKGNRK